MRNFRIDLGQLPKLSVFWGTVEETPGAAIAFLESASHLFIDLLHFDLPLDKCADVIWFEMRCTSLLNLFYFLYKHRIFDVDDRCGLLPCHSTGILLVPPKFFHIL